MKVSIPRLSFCPAPDIGFLFSAFPASESVDDERGPSDNWSFVVSLAETLGSRDDEASADDGRGPSERSSLRRFWTSWIESKLGQYSNRALQRRIRFSPTNWAENNFLTNEPVSDESFVISTEWIFLANVCAKLNWSFCGKRMATSAGDLLDMLNGFSPRVVGSCSAWWMLGGCSSLSSPAVELLWK